MIALVVLGCAVGAVVSLASVLDDEIHDDIKRKWWEF